VRLPGASREELDRWVLETAPRAVAYATSLLRNRDEAEDIVQDCYCRLLAKAGKYDLPNDGLKLLLTSVSNACINRRTRRRSIWSLSSVGADGDPFDPPETDVARPDEIAIGHELETRIAAGLARLPVAQRAAVELKSLGHTQQEVAEILGITPTHAGVLIHRARQSLQNFLETDRA
jgi:RNA polymerase sigma-70 factor, ECF subfamily